MSVFEASRSTSAHADEQLRVAISLTSDAVKRWCGTDVETVEAAHGCGG